MGVGVDTFFFQFPHSLDTDADSVTKIPGDWFGPESLERRTCEAIKTDFLFGDGFQLELVAVCIRQNHLKKTCSVSLLDMMKKELAREAEVAAVTHAIEVGILRPFREIPGKSTLPHKLVEMFVNFLVHLLKLPVV
jgi:hypothetical protein